MTEVDDGIEVFYTGEVILRKEALEKGLKRYFTGKPCKYGHISQRSATGGTCVTCSHLRGIEKAKLLPKSTKVNGVDYGYKKGQPSINKGKSKTKVGEVYTSCGGYGDYVVTNYVSASEVHIKFLGSGWEDVVWSSAARRGKVKDYLTPYVLDVGFNSLGKLRGGPNNVKLNKAHIKWGDMLDRCYNPDKHKTNPTYIGCTVAEEWHDFAKFWEWFEVTCDSEDKLKFHLDKDFIFKGNKVYSAETCFLVPRKINNLITSHISSKDEDIPTGVHLYKATGRYQAYYNDISGKRIKLGYHKTAEEAFSVYKTHKELVIKETAEFYKDVIDERLYKILMEYELHFEERF